MDPNLAGVLAAHGGVAALADLAAGGISSKTAGRAVARGDLVRIQRGAFVAAAAWNAAPDWERHELRARAVGRSKLGYASPYALSHHSALALWGVDLYGVDQRVHLVRTDGRRGNSCPSSQVHAPVPPERAAVSRHGLRTVLPAAATIQVASTFGVAAGLVSADAGLRLGLYSRVDLAAACREASTNAPSRDAGMVADHADSARESAGESRCWLLLRQLGGPPPALQAWIYDPLSGSSIGRVDFLFASLRTVVEFDGMLKYDDRQALRLEKIREDRIREAGYEVVRLTWADLERPERALAQVRAAFARADLRMPPPPSDMETPSARR